jgi:thioredoxin:protein disulfide reductase
MTSLANLNAHYLRSFGFLALALCLLVTASPKGNAFDFGQSAKQESEFLSVDQAFVFDSEITASGLRLKWHITDGYYLYQSKVELSSTDGRATLGEPIFSDLGIEEEDPYFGTTRVVYKELAVDLPVNLIPGARDTEISVKYQGCATAGLCYPPETKTILFIPPASTDAEPIGDAPLAQANSTANESNQADETAQPSPKETIDSEDASSIFAFMQDSSLLALIGIFFLLGLGLTFTPCVLPMIPIITSIVAGPDGAKQSTARNFSLAISYVLGMAITYAALGLAVGLLGAGANLQATMQSPSVLIFFAFIFIVLACAMFGLFDLQLPSFLRDKLQNTSNRYSGGTFFSVFVIGALSALLVSPCVSAPLAGALLYISASGDALLGFSSLFSLGIGMGVPLIIVAVGGARFLPKTGAWMNASKFLFGVLLLSVAVWLLGRIIPGPYSLALWAFLALFSAVHMGAFEAANSGVEKLAKSVALAVFLIAAIWLVGAFTGASDPFNPLQNLKPGIDNGSNQSKSQPEFQKVYSLAELDSALDVAKEKEQKAFVDIYADWCISCIIMEREVFVQADVQALLNQFHLIKVDVTKNSNENIQLLEDLQLFGPPSYLLFNEQKNEIKDLRIVGEISKDAFVERLQAALARP